MGLRSLPTEGRMSTLVTPTRSLDTRDPEQWTPTFPRRGHQADGRWTDGRWVTPFQGRDGALFLFETGSSTRRSRTRTKKRYTRDPSSGRGRHFTLSSLSLCRRIRTPPRLVSPTSMSHDSVSLSLGTVYPVEWCSSVRARNSPTSPVRKLVPTRSSLDCRGLPPTGWDGVVYPPIKNWGVLLLLSLLTSPNWIRGPLRGTNVGGKGCWVSRYTRSGPQGT